MNAERRIQFLMNQQERKEARQGTSSAGSARRSAAAKRRMDRVERKMAQTYRIVTRMVRGGVSLPSVVRRINQNLAQASKTLLKISARLAEIHGKSKALHRLRGSSQLRRRSAGVRTYCCITKIH